MNSGRIIKPRYEMTSYDGQEVVTRTLSNEQMAQIDPQSFDYYLSLNRGIWAFRDIDGKWIEHNNAIWPGLGYVSIRLIQAMQLNVMEGFQRPDEIAELTGCTTLRNGNALSARLKAIRDSHQESYEQAHFFLSRRAGGFAIAWNPQYTWLSLERIRSDRQ